ncbi:MAG TPA: hypothetical protein VH082_02285 [Rudaea sp.]|jgi:hypothetical protein|nr:hypothetical protein [Rudaea sp.]
MRGLILLSLLVLAGCDSFGGSRAENHHVTPTVSGDLVLSGEFDNHEQLQPAGAAVAVPHVHETLRLAENDRNGHLWMWRLRSGEGATAAEAAWLYRVATTDNGNRSTFTPYRALDDAARAALVAGKDFKFDDKQWAELTPCTLNGEHKDGKLVASADVGACSALLPGLGATAALLPLKLTFDGDMLSTVTFADQARGATASIDARRVRFFAGWSAINGGGPKMQTTNQDWHTRQDLRASSEGGRVPVRWRDGAASGYSIELVRRTYAERKLSVLQLNVIEDATGQTIDYAWADPSTSNMGINLGWLQIGLTVENTAR